MDESEQIAQEILRSYEPTEEDISRELTYDQLVKLCRRNRCRVDMWKWNVVEDFTHNFSNAGRFEGKSKKFIHKLLIKAYQRSKELFRQTEIDKDTERMEEWTYRKKNSLLQLSLWEYEEEVEVTTPQEDYENTEHSSLTSNNEDALLQETISNFLETEVEEQNPAVNVVTLHPSMNKDHTEHISLTSNNEDALLQETISNLLETEVEEQNPAVNVVTLHPSMNKNQTRKEDQVDNEYLNINSESVTISTQNLTDIDELPYIYNRERSLLSISDMQETPIQPAVATQSETYDDFNERMPLTSTQDAVC